MTFKEYEEAAAATAIYPDEHKLIYPTLGLVGEAGEVAEKVKKRLRDGVGSNLAIAKEIGDVLWYVAAVVRDLGFSMDEIAEMNLEKLRDRAERGKLGGSGDER